MNELNPLILTENHGISARLEALNITVTHQRLVIASIMLAKCQHLSADQVIDQLRAMGAGVSKATVYNTLGLFARKGLLKEVTVDPARIFYDSNTRPHYHFYNVDDGTLTDIDADRVELTFLADTPLGTTLDSTDIIFRLRNQD